jgi:hypothetical protein
MKTVRACLPLVRAASNRIVPFTLPFLLTTSLMRSAATSPTRIAAQCVSIRTALFRAGWRRVATWSSTLRSSLLDSTLACGMTSPPKHHFSTHAAYFLMFYQGDRKDGREIAKFLNGLRENIRFRAFSYVS